MASFLMVITSAALSLITSTFYKPARSCLQSGSPTCSILRLSACLHCGWTVSVSTYVFCFLFMFFFMWECVRLHFSAFYSWRWMGLGGKGWFSWERWKKICFFNCVIPNGGRMNIWHSTFKKRRPALVHFEFRFCHKGIKNGLIQIQNQD